MTDPRSDFSVNLILYELQKIHEVLSTTREEHTLNFRMIKPTEKINFSEPILNRTKFGFIGLSVYNSVFNVNRRNNQFLYASTVIDNDSALAEPPISNNKSVLNYNYKANPLLYSTITSGAYDLTEIAE